MALYQLTKGSMDLIDPTTFSSLGYRERDDLQRLLRERIEISVPGGMVVAEEFGDWDDSNRRIDLLVLDPDANLVVVELKRTEDGGHSELQALRYAAMISAITFKQAVEAHRVFLARLGKDTDPEASLLEFLGWEAPDEERFAQDVRIVLASAEFSKELTTSVIWLNEQGIDIRCVRMKPYAYKGQALLDIQQVLPLPEAQEYQVRVREKAQSEKTARRVQSEAGKRYQAYWAELQQKAALQLSLHTSISAPDRQYMSAGQRGLVMGYVFAYGQPRVELYLDRPLTEENKKVFDELLAKRDVIENAFGKPLKWERLDDRKAARVSYAVPSQGSFSDEDSWETLQEDMIAAMIQLEKTIGPHIQKYRDGAPILSSEVTA